MTSDVSLMTKGSIYMRIVKFALPLFWGQLFQQMYNMVDAIVVGNYVGKSALAAVSSTTSLTMIFVGFFVGTFSGAGVVIAKYFGAEREDCVHDAIHTSVAFGLAAGLLLTVAGVLLTPLVLEWMRTPADVFDEAVTYLRIYFLGALPVVLYNASSGIFQAVGDSRHPLYYLIISSVANVGLDLLFVAKLDMGVGGAALATVISQILGTVLAFRRLCASNEIYQVKIKKISFKKHYLLEIIRTGLPAGVQNSVISFSNILIQSNINAFGSSAMAGCGAYSKIQGFAFIPISSFAMAITTFTGQNLGARQYSRAKRGALFAIIATFVMSEVLGGIFYIFAPQLISLFNNAPDVVDVGARQAQTAALFFGFCGFAHCCAGILRGAGKSSVPMFILLTCWCLFRVVYLYIISFFITDIRVIFWAHPISWVLSGIIFTIYMLKSDWVHGLEKPRKHLKAS